MGPFSIGELLANSPILVYNGLRDWLERGGLRCGY